MTHKICDQCETVAHCSKHGCIPLQPQSKRQTTPEEAKELADKYYLSLIDNDLNRLAALIDEAVANAPLRGVDAEPVAWRHRDPTWSGWATTNEQWKANLPIGWEEEPLYTHPAPSQPAVASAPTQPTELPDRLVCASTCMEVKFDGKTCKCYPNR